MLNGIINVYKEPGFTSHDVVAKLRGIAGQKKIGHTGTLDPDAEGVLPVCLGKATKVCDLLADRTKTYEAKLLLGTVTDTQDTSGTVLETSEEIPAETAVREAILSFQGEISQIPPMYSALKVNGKKLYELAREGKIVERKSRRVTIYEIEILKIDLPYADIRVTCSKGTYIRTLCHDIGQKLGCGGCMAHLVRTRVGEFCVADAKRLGELQQLKDAGSLGKILIPIDHLFEDDVKISFHPSAKRIADNGNPLPLSELIHRPALSDGQRVRVYDTNDSFYGLYEYNEAHSVLKPQKIFKDFNHS